MATLTREITHSLQILILIQGLITIVIFFLPPYSALDLNLKINLFFKWAILPFTIITAISTWLLFSVTEKRNKIEDLRFELEKVYGPLFALCLDLIEWFEAAGDPTMSLAEGARFNEIFETYPHVLSPELWDHWKENIITQSPRLAGVDVYYFDPQFVGDLIAEYYEKVKSYRKLVGKEARIRKQQNQRKTTMTFK